MLHDLLEGLWNAQEEIAQTYERCKERHDLDIAALKRFPLGEDVPVGEKVVEQATSDTTDVS